MKLADILKFKESGEAVRIKMGTIEVRGGSVDPLQSGWLKAKVLDAGHHIKREREEALRAKGESVSWRDKTKYTVKVETLEPTALYGYRKVPAGSIIYLASRQVLIGADEALELERQRDEARRAYERQREEKTRANEELAERMHRLQLEAGLTDTDFSGNIVPLVRFHIDSHRGTIYARPDVDDLVQLIEAAAKTTTEEVVG